MLPEKRTNTNVFVGVGVLLQLAGFFFLQSADSTAVLGLVLVVCSIPVFIWGCMNYAEGKGHSKWVGFVGLAGIIGLICLILLPDQDRKFDSRLQLRRVVGLICLMVGLGLVVFGRWLSSVWQASEFDRLLDPWRTGSTLLGTILVVVSLFLMLHNSSTVDNSLNEDAND